MFFAMEEARAGRLFSWLEAYEDAEAGGDGGYSVDLYDAEPPMAIEIYPAKGGIDITAAAKLKFDDEWDGWKLDERIEDEAGLRSALDALINAEQ